ncbi:MAG TPA: DMT family transporter [Gemmatimonadota bacterium]|jgi:drug/metabolite transporter (DMT)-like permease|nr:DMT family transporter [Gemmatimonadota bacterium]
MRAEERRGTAAILVSAASYGFLSILGKLAFAAGVDVLPLAAWRFLIGAAVVWILLAARRRPLPPLRRWPGLAALGLLYAIDSLSYLAALQWVPASTAVLLFYVYPVVVVLLAALFLGEHLTRRKLTATALALTGCALTVGSGISGGRPLGLALVVFAMLALSTYIVASRPIMASLPAHGSAAVTLTSTGLLLTAAALGFDDMRLDGGTRGLVYVLALSLLCTALPITLFLVGIRHVGAGRAAVYSTIEPLVTVSLAAIVLRERIGVLQCLGGALILTAILWLRAERPLPMSEKPTPLDAP